MARSKKFDAKKANAEAEILLKSLTLAQLEEVGVMFGMSNLGQDWKDRPENIAETDEMYDMMMDEIRHWQKRLKCNRKNWGWALGDVKDGRLSQMVAKAIARRPDWQVFNTTGQ